MWIQQLQKKYERKDTNDKLMMPTKTQVLRVKRSLIGMETGKLEILGLKLAALETIYVTAHPETIL